MKTLNKLFLLFSVGAFFSCSDLDIPPMNIVGENEIFGSKDGVTAYIARMYSTLPMEDFKYYHPDGNLFGSNATKYCQQSCLTGEAVGRDTNGAENEGGNYWDNPYKYIRVACQLLETLPKYKANYVESDYNTWIGEAYFCRAYIYYSLVKRYGGVPLIDHVVDYPASVTLEETQVPRNSEEEIWDFIASDLDKAYELLPATNQKGRIDKYGAAAYKSEMMLHAGSIAKYNEANLVDSNTGKRVCGIPAAKANDYFKQAYEASKLVDGGKYSLYVGQFVKGNRQAIADNFQSIFTGTTCETIFGRWYKSPDAVHDFDDSAQPQQTSTGNNNSELNPTLDFVEMFDGFDKDVNGKIKVFDENGHYRLFDTPYDIFANCEPRLEASVILPHSMFKNQVIDLRYGIWLGESAATMGPLLTESENFSQNYSAKYEPSTSNLRAAGGAANLKLPDGTTMAICGASGVYNAWNFGGISGFYQRKYLNPKAGSNNTGSVSDQPWIDIRYAEVLLNRAEAAMELTDAGQGNYKQEVFELINKIRERAGADLLASPSDANISVVRKERRKELAFEHKAFWDLKRWRILHIEQNNTKYRTLTQIYSFVDKKYFLDPKYQENRGGRSYLYTFDQKRYYSPIPSSAYTRNPMVINNPGY